MADEKKPWYKSKLILLGATAVVIFGAQLANNWLTGHGVTPTQIESVRVASPEIASAIERVQAGENVLTVVGGLVGVFVMIFRAWFTSKSIG